MPLGDLAAGLLGFVGRMLGQFVVELLLEIVVKGPGYLLARSLRRRETDRIDPDGWLAVLLGIVFWGVIGLAVYLVVSGLDQAG